MQEVKYKTLFQRGGKTEAKYEMIVSFDLDGVLMENPFGDHVFPAAVEKILRMCREKNSHAGGEEIGPVPSKEDIWQVILDIHRTRLKAGDYKAYNWDEIVKEAADTLGVKGNIDIEKLVRENCNPPAVKGYKDGKEFLKWLEKKKSVNEIAAITNGFNKYQAPVLQALSLEKYFDSIITPDKARAVKPDEEMFSSLKTGDEWLHVGDSVLMDILGASRVGAKTALVRRDLNEKLRSAAPGLRPQTEEGRNLLKKMAGHEAGLHGVEWNLDEIIPDLIVDDLRQLKKLDLLHNCW